MKLACWSEREVEEATFSEEDRKKVFRIGRGLEVEVRKALVNLLKENFDPFTCSTEDMPGIPSDVITPQLKVGPNFPPVNYVREVIYPSWLANPVVVKKANIE